MRVVMGAYLLVDSVLVPWFAAPLTVDDCER